MALSKKNLDQLKSILNENTSKHNIYNKSSISDSSSLKKDHSIEVDNPNQIFYSIIDNSEHLEDTLATNNNLKKIEEKLIKEKKYYPFDNKIDSQINNKLKDSEERFIKENKTYFLDNQINSQKNNQLSEEDLLYDEFNYLLDE